MNTGAGSSSTRVRGNRHNTRGQLLLVCLCRATLACGSRGGNTHCSTVTHLSCSCMTSQAALSVLLSLLSRCQNKHNCLVLLSQPLTTAYITLPHTHRAWLLA